MADIARAGRARWKIENEGFNCLARHGYNIKRNFGQDRAVIEDRLARIPGRPACKKIANAAIDILVRSKYA